MAGLTLAQAEAGLARWLTADEKVANGQAYSIGGKSLTRADADMISRNIDTWNRRVESLSPDGGISVRGITIDD